VPRTPFNSSVQLWQRKLRTATIFTSGHDLRLLEIQWNEEQIGLLFDIPVTRPVRRSSAVSRNEAMFKSSAFHMRPTTANPLRICRLSRDHGKEREWLGSLAKNRHSATVPR
jgi:hypothetical protein